MFHHNPFCVWPRHRLLLLCLGVLWLGLSFCGMLRMRAYANAPGAPGLPPLTWPDRSSIHRDPTKPTLLFFIHPQCPCSQASVEELAELMAHCVGRVNADALLLSPNQANATWDDEAARKALARIPGVVVIRDTQGREATLFHIETSGDTVLYDTNGILEFHGGITPSRGHVGDNVGRDSLQALLLGMPSEQSTGPVFGCPLFQCTRTANN